MKQSSSKAKNENPLNEYFVSILVQDTGIQLLHCPICNLVFESDDMVLQKIQGRDRSWLACPIRKKKKFPWFIGGYYVESCLGRLTGWSKEFFEKEYILQDLND